MADITTNEHTKDLSQEKPLIYIGDLTHYTNVISIEYFPLGIGYITAYTKKIFPEKFDIEMFKFPDKLFDAIDAKLPDILALSFFAWNRNLSLMVAKYYKERKPDGLVIFGGPGFPSILEEQTNFFKTNKQVDIFVHHDGEFAFVEVLKTYLEKNNSKEEILKSPIDGCVFLDMNRGILVKGKDISRPEDIDDIPSPYLTGLMDKYFDNQILTPIIQTTRGCPFRCGYCWAGNPRNSLIRHFSYDRISAELDYVAKRRANKQNQLLTFSDSNFGMYPLDEKITDKLASLQKEHNFPHSFDVPFGKNNKERVIKVIKQIKNCRTTLSVQSTDDTILANVSRQPVPLDKYKEIVECFHKEKIPVATEIITGLPGETRQTHLNTLKELISIGIDEFDAFTLMFLEGIAIDSAARGRDYCASSL